MALHILRALSGQILATPRTAFGPQTSPAPVLIMTTLGMEHIIKCLARSISLKEIAK